MRCAATLDLFSPMAKVTAVPSMSLDTGLSQTPTQSQIMSQNKLCFTLKMPECYQFSI